MWLFCMRNNREYRFFWYFTICFTVTGTSLRSSSVTLRLQQTDVRTLCQIYLADCHNLYFSLSLNMCYSLRIAARLNKYCHILSFNVNHCYLMQLFIAVQITREEQLNLSCKVNCFAHSRHSHSPLITHTRACVYTHTLARSRAQTKLPAKHRSKFIMSK